MDKNIYRAQTNIDLLMHENGIKTDKELSEKIGVSTTTLSMRLKGALSMKTLTEIAKYFDVSVKDLLR